MHDDGDDDDGRKRERERRRERGGGGRGMEVSEEEVEQLLELAWWGRREQRWVEVTDLGGVHRAFMQAYGNRGCRRRALTALKMVMTDTLRRLSRQRGGTDAVHIEAQAEENLSRLGNNQTGDFELIL